MTGGHRTLMGMGSRLWRRLVVESVERAEAGSLGHLKGRSSPHEGKVICVCIVAAVNLALLNYFGMSNKLGVVARTLGTFLTWMGWDTARADLGAWLMDGTHARLYSLLFWASSCVFLYFVVPVLVVKLVFRQSLAEYGLVFKGGLRHIKIYLVLFLLVLPAVVAVSFTDAFQQQYPFYQDYSAGIPPGFLIWELAYAAQFFALEFFFRGFMVHGLKHRFGFYAVLVMVIPYCMIHFGKPFPETMAAILAGTVLGLLSLRTGTILPGFMIHVSVAWSMDLAALLQKGLL